MVSNAGSWLQTVALGAYMVDLTGKATWVGLIAVAAFLPMGVFAPLGGDLADRFDRRRFLLVTNAIEASIATVLAVVVARGDPSPWMIVALAFCGGCVVSVRLPFIQALMPDLVPADDLLAAASLGAAQYNLGRVIGPAVAGVVIAAWGFEWAFAGNAMSYGATILALTFVAVPRRERVPATEPLWARLRAGARAARDEPGCRSAILLIGVAAFFAAPFIALIAVKAASITSGGEDEIAKATAALTTAQGVGAVTGALTLADLANRFGRRRLLVFHLLATPVALILYAQAPNLATAVPALALVGAMYIGILSGLNTVVQLRAPTEFRGRVLSLHMLSLGGIYPLGALVQGRMADSVSIATTTTVGALALIGVVAVLASARPQLLRALDDPPEMAGDVPAQPEPATPDRQAVG